MKTPVSPLAAAACAAALVLLASPARAGDDLLGRIVAAELARRHDPALFVRAAAAPDAAIRRAAARAIGRIRPDAPPPWLWTLVRDEAGPVRRAAFFALGQMKTASAVVPLRAGLDDLAVADLPFALEALGKIGDVRATAAVTAFLRHEDPFVQGAAALALFRLGDASAVPDLLGALAAEPSPEARWRIVYAAWRLLQKRTRAANARVPARDVPTAGLRAAVDAERPYFERVFAVQALGQVAGEREFLATHALADADPRVQVAGIRALARPWDADALPLVRPLLDHDDALVRETALDFLVAGGEDARDALADAAQVLAGDPRLSIPARAAAAAAGAPVSVDPAARTGTVAHHEELVWRVNAHFPDRLPAETPATLAGQRACAEVCGEERVPKERAFAALLALLEADDWTVRATALGSLAKRGDPSHAPAIVAAAARAIGTKELDVRLEAANALATLEAYDPWLDAAAADDPDRPVRDAARAALEKLGKPRPPAPPPPGFALHGHDAQGILAAAENLRGARVVLVTNRGTIEIVLYPDEAPVHCVNVARLVEQGFYDGLTWHRVVADFVIQGGCPRGDGWGGPGYLLPDEIGTRPYVRGTLGMPKSGDDTGGCQLFVTHLPTPHLDGRYTVFGQVVSGLDVVDRIRIGDTIEQATLRGE